VTNGLLPDQIVRKRRCAECKHQWYTVEVTVPDYAVGWSKEHKRKPVLRVPVNVAASAIEAKDQFAGFREANRRRSLAADARYAA